MRILLLSLLLVSQTMAALTTEQLATLKQKLADLDPAVRQQALRELERGDAKAVGTEVLPLLSSALADHDAKVRANVAALLAVISYSTTPKFIDRAKTGAPDFRSFPPIEAALIAALDDPDEETRKNALAAYALEFKVSPAVQNALASRYDAERSFSIFRSAILEALIIDGEPTPAAIALLVRVADSPQDSRILAQVVQDTKTPPKELLPHFGTQFMSAHDENVKALFAKAIAKFGTLAKPYVPELERAADSASNEIAKQNITKAAEAIQASR